MQEEEEKTDWAFYFSTLSDKCLEEIDSHLRPEIRKRRSNPNVTDQEKATALSGRKIEAIKNYRERTGAGLKEAKDAIESVM